MQTIKYRTDHKQIGIDTKVQLTGKVIEIFADAESPVIELTLEVTEFEKIYDK